MLSTAIYKLVGSAQTGQTAHMPRAVKPKPRRRLDAEAARQLILDAAEKRLVVVGPSGIRLQEVAADAGVSHPTVLHHFGSRELLVKAVILRSVEQINTSLVAALQRASDGAGGDDLAESLIENAHQAFERTGHGRVLIWLALEGHAVEGGKVKLTDIVDATHALRLARKKDAAKRVSRDDTAHTVVLAALALVAGAVLTPTLLANAGLASDARANVTFRKWLARVLLEHIDAT
jgi:AcrR family transcriptional regulator